MKSVLCLSAFLVLVSGAFGANILAVIPFPSKSHAIIIERLIQGLESKGHSLTLLTSITPQVPLGNTKVIEIKNVHERMQEQIKAFTGGSGNLFEMRHMSPIAAVLGMPMMGMPVCDIVLGDEAVQQLKQSKQKFDAVIGEIFVDESVLAGFSHHFQAPLIAFNSFMPHIWANYLVGNPAPSSFIPDPFLGYSSRMTFLQRLTNFLFGSFSEFYHTNFYLPKQDEMMRKHFSPDMPSIFDLLKNTSLVLINHHFSIGFPRPLVPNMVEVGGLHVKEPKELPAELKKYMDESKNGVVYFSMGSNLRSADLSTEMIKDILGAFSRLKQNVLWKFESQLENLPKNVKIMSWLPQSDLLAHPNMKLFITHGGQMSTIESFHRGVPVVGIPIFGDQPLNMRHTEIAGLGKTLSFDELTESTFYDAISEVLNNPRYRENAKRKSALLKDMPMQSLERATWWVDYVIRHQGAPHLRSSAQDLAGYEYYLWDVYATCAVVIISIAAISIYIVKAILRKFFCSKCSTKSGDKGKGAKKTN